MYELDVDFLDDFGNISNLTFSNVTYVCFRFYDITFFLKDKKDFIKISNVLNVNIKKK